MLGFFYYQRQDQIYSNADDQNNGIIPSPTTIKNSAGKNDKCFPCADIDLAAEEVPDHKEGEKYHDKQVGIKYHD